VITGGYRVVGLPALDLGPRLERLAQLFVGFAVSGFRRRQASLTGGVVLPIVLAILLPIIEINQWVG
jgi:hypothetical protein